jgi:CheY-like chemotaxis protein
MRTLILIDNNKDTFQFMKEACGSVDPNIHCVSFVYAEEAVKTLMTGFIKKPDAVFINLNMPGKNGVKCLMELRSNPTLVDLPIILYAPIITREVVEALKGSGMTTIFEKPNTIVGWKGVMREMLNSMDNVEINLEAFNVGSKTSMLYVA